MEEKQILSMMFSPNKSSDHNHVYKVDLMLKTASKKIQVNLIDGPTRGKHSTDYLGDLIRVHGKFYTRIGETHDYSFVRFWTKLVGGPHDGKEVPKTPKSIIFYDGIRYKQNAPHGIFEYYPED